MEWKKYISQQLTNSLDLFLVSILLLMQTCWYFQQKSYKTNSRNTPFKQPNSAVCLLRFIKAVIVNLLHLKILTLGALWLGHLKLPLLLLLFFAICLHWNIIECFFLPSNYCQLIHKYLKRILNSHQSLH